MFISYSDFTHKENFWLKTRDDYRQTAVHIFLVDLLAQPIDTNATVTCYTRLGALVDRVMGLENGYIASFNLTRGYYKFSIDAPGYKGKSRFIHVPGHSNFPISIKVQMTPKQKPIANYTFPSNPTEKSTDP